MFKQQPGFHRDTGQVYREWLVSLGKPDDTGGYCWAQERMLPPGIKRLATVTAPTMSGSGSKGARSLVDMCAAVAVDNSNLFEAEHLENVPEPALRSIWKQLVVINNLTFSEWMLFHKIMARSGVPRDQPTLFKHRVHSQEVSIPRACLEAYVQPLVSPNFDFVVHLTIAGGARFSGSELARHLPQLTNLGVLEIIQPRNQDKAEAFPRITDSVIKEWLQIPGIFPCLRILRIWGEDFVTIRSVKDVMRFPALAVYDIAGRTDDIDFRRHKAMRWTFSKTPNWKHYGGWAASGADFDPKGYRSGGCDEKPQPRWVFTTKAWETKSYKNPISVRSSDSYQGRYSVWANPVSMPLKALIAESEAGGSNEREFQAPDWNCFVDNFDHMLRGYTTGGNKEPVSFVPDNDVTKCVGLHSGRTATGPFTIPTTHHKANSISTLRNSITGTPDPKGRYELSRSLCFGSWGFMLYSQIGKLWRDGDLRAQGRPISKMTSFLNKMQKGGGLYYIIPTRPYVLLSLGQLDRFYCPDRERVNTYIPTGEMEAHVTFVRVDEPSFADASTTAENAPDIVPKKRTPDKATGLQPTEVRQTKRQRDSERPGPQPAQTQHGQTELRSRARPQVRPRVAQRDIGALLAEFNTGNDHS